MWMITLATILLFIFAYLKLIKPFNYWHKKGIPYLKPWPIIGNMSTVIFRTKAFGYYLQDVYNQFSNERYLGFYQFLQPTLFVRDVELVKQICIKDFDSFTDHYEFLPESADPLWNRNLFSMTGKKWHNMRAVLSPSFTSSKMKAMFGLMQECAQEFTKYLETQPHSVTLEMKDTFKRVTNDIIASTAFGVKCNSLINKDNEFYALGKELFNFDGFKSLKFFGYSISPILMKLLKVQIFNDYSQKFFTKIVKDSIKHREETGLVRPDMIHLLKEAQKESLKSATKAEDNATNQSNENSVITDEDIVAQALVFFFAGFDTVASTLSNTSFELALNQNVQDILIKEIDDTLQEHGGTITYDALLDMKYLDMVVSEILRMWSAAIFVTRKAVKDFTVEPKLPGEKALHLKAGIPILLPIFAIHRDPQYYSNPEKFNPERFVETSKNDIPIGAYLPFGLGPRFCIGSRFAMLEVKIVLFHLLAKFKIVTVKETPEALRLSKKNVNAVSDEGYWLGLQRRHKNK